MFFKLYYRIIKSKRIKIFSIFLAILILAGLFFLSFAKTSFVSVESRAEFLRSHPTIQKLLPLYWKIRKIGDITYFPYVFKKNELPTYRLVIKPENLKILNDNLPDEFMSVIYGDKTYVPAKFYYQEKEYDVKVRYRGDTAIHWNAPKKSYHVKFDKDQPFNGFRELAFVIADDRKFVLEYFNNYRADKFGLFHPPSFFANLNLNGNKQGLYFVIEGWSQEMLTKWEVPDEANLYGDDNFGVVWDSPFGWRLVTKDSQDRFAFDNFSAMNYLLDLFSNSTDEEFFSQIFNLLDEENFYNWQIQNQLINSSHQNLGNIQFYFDDSRGKFYIIPWDVMGDSVDTDNFTNYGPIARRIFTNPEFFHKKNLMLYQYVSDEKNLEDDLKFYDQSYNSIKPALYKDREKIYTNAWADSIYKENREKIITVFNRLKEHLKSGSIFAEIAVNDDDNIKINSVNLLAEINLTAKSVPEFYLISVKPELIDNLAEADYQLYYDSNSNNEFDLKDQKLEDPKKVMIYSRQAINPVNSRLEPQSTKYKFFLVSNNVSPQEFAGKVKSFELELENAITAEILEKENIDLKIVGRNVFKYFSAINDISGFIKKYPIFKVDESSKEILLDSGFYQINQTVIVPKGFTLKIMAGANLIFGPKTSLVSYSPVLALGTKEKPIIISGQSGSQPWGVFAVLDQGKQESKFSYVQFLGGKDDYINGAYFSGQLSVYFSDVLIDNCQFSDANADDSLNVKKSKVIISNSLFFNNSADAIDFDFIKDGEINNSRFFNNGNDGIDISGSEVLLKGNYIEKSGDKCISIGEYSRGSKIYNNVLNGCNIGIEVKDGSNPFIINNVIVNNNIGINAYVKKPVFSGDLITVYNSIIWNNKEPIKTADNMSIEIYSSDLPVYSDKNNNFDIEPIFSNPDEKDFTINKDNVKMSFIDKGNSAILESVLNIKIKKAPIGLIR